MHFWTYISKILSICMKTKLTSRLVQKPCLHTRESFKIPYFSMQNAIFYCKFWLLEYFLRPKPDIGVEIWLLMATHLTPFIRSLSRSSQEWLLRDQILQREVMQLAITSEQDWGVIFMRKMLILLAAGGNMIHMSLNVQCHKSFLPSSVGCW